MTYKINDKVIASDRGMRQVPMRVVAFNEAGDLFLEYEHWRDSRKHPEMEYYKKRPEQVRPV